MQEIIYTIQASFINYIDFIWVPIGFFIVHKKHKLMTVAFVLSCLLSLRLQVEIMESIGYVQGVLPLLKSHVLQRGMVCYSVLIMLFLILAYYSPKTRPIVYFAATMTVYVLALCISMVIMAL